MAGRIVIRCCIWIYIKGTIILTNTVKLKDTYPGHALYKPELPIYVFDNFISDFESEHIIQLAKPKLKQANVSSAKLGVKSKNRTNQVAWLNKQVDEITTTISNRVADLIGLPINHSENMQVIYYEVEQEYRAHFDAYDLNSAAGKRCCDKMGQRLITTLTYLSDVTAGGETEFTKLGLRVKPKKGTMLLFHNCYAGTSERHPDSLHQGSPVIDGKKWAFNLWFHERAVK